MEKEMLVVAKLKEGTFEKFMNFSKVPSFNFATTNISFSIFSPLSFVNIEFELPF